MQKRVNEEFFREDLRKVGLACVSAGIIGLFVTPHIALVWFFALIIFGLGLWYFGLLEKEKK